MKCWSKILHDCWLERSLERVCKISPYPREMQTSVEIVAIGREGYAVTGVCKRATCLTFAIPFHERGHELERWKRGRGTAERDVSKFPDAHSHRFLSSVSRRGGGEQMLSILSQGICMHIRKLTFTVVSANIDSNNDRWMDRRGWL